MVIILIVIYIISVVIMYIISGYEPEDNLSDFIGVFVPILNTLLVIIHIIVAILYLFQSIINYILTKLKSWLRK